MAQTRDIEVRPARGVAERDAALGLRRQVFVGEQGIPPRLETDSRDADALHLVAIRDRKVIGTCRLVIERRTAKLGRLARRGAPPRLRDARARALAARGFVRLGAPFREAGIEHVRMEKQLA